jgi:transmembrane 9 superfamily protein 3
MNTVGPYHNRQETYNYFSLPFCRGTKKEVSHYHETLGENILGVELEYSGVDISFKRKLFNLILSKKLFRIFLGDKTKTEFCEVILTPENYDAFNYAIKNHYWYQMFIDDLPIWG